MFIKGTAVKTQSHNPNAPVSVEEVELVDTDHVVRVRRTKNGGARLFFVTGEPFDTGETFDALLHALGAATT